MCSSDLLARVLDTGLANEGIGGYLHSSDGVERKPAGWMINGSPLDPTRTYRVGINDFLMSGREANMGFLTRTTPGISEVEEQRDIRRGCDRGPATHLSVDLGDVAVMTSGS